MDPLSIFSPGSNEHIVIHRFQTTFLPLLPPILKIHFLKFSWENLTFKPYSIYPCSHRFAKAIRLPNRDNHWAQGSIEPSSIAAAANVIVLQCIWGHRVFKHAYYVEMQKYWGEVLSLLPTEPCEGLDFKKQIAVRKSGIGTKRRATTSLGKRMVDRGMQTEDANMGEWGGNRRVKEKCCRCGQGGQSVRNITRGSEIEGDDDDNDDGLFKYGVQ